MHAKLNEIQYKVHMPVHRTKSTIKRKRENVYRVFRNRFATRRRAILEVISSKIMLIRYWSYFQPRRSYGGFKVRAGKINESINQVIYCYVL
jgi:hypothetical protein